MTISRLASAIGFVWVAVSPLAASADHLSLTPDARPVDGAPRSTEVELKLKLESDGFRLGARMFGDGGVSGAWLNGKLRPDGLTLDGRVQADGRAHNFTLNADIPALLGRWLSRGWLSRD